MNAQTTTEQSTGKTASDTYHKPKAPWDDAKKKYDNLVKKYLSFAKQKTETIIEMAQVVFEADRDLPEKSKDVSNHTFEDFCAAVLLDPKGSTVRKYKAIGAKAERFKPHLDVLRKANNWTTLYELSSLDDDQFERVVEDDSFKTKPTMKNLKEALSIKSPTRTSDGYSAAMAITCPQGTSDKAKLELYKQLQELLEDKGFKIKPLAKDLQDLLEKHAA